jgi:DnaJ-class molecular chaperone
VNYYTILGVFEDATAAQIKAAYRKLASKNHPDKLGGDGQARMAAINQAYEVLSDPKRREAYDTLGEDDAPPLEERAVANLQAMFNNWLNTEHIICGDMVENMRDATKNAQSEFKDKGIQLRRKSNAMLKKASRIKGKGSEMFTVLAAHRSDELLKEAAKMDLEIEVSKRMLEILKTITDTAPDEESEDAVLTMFATFGRPR